METYKHVCGAIIGVGAHHNGVEIVNDFYDAVTGVEIELCPGCGEAVYGWAERPEGYPCAILHGLSALSEAEWEAFEQARLSYGDADDVLGAYVDNCRRRVAERDVLSERLAREAELRRLKEEQRRFDLALSALPEPLRGAVVGDSVSRDVERADCVLLHIYLHGAPVLWASVAVSLQRDEARMVALMPLRVVGASAGEVILREGQRMELGSLDEAARQAVIDRSVVMAADQVDAYRVALDEAARQAVLSTPEHVCAEEIVEVVCAWGEGREVLRASDLADVGRKVLADIYGEEVVGRLMNAADDFPF